ncbi:MAG: hypothetical protein BWX80_03341 [Candidatus Hydrogenedentes bacterium ADurb.Bin101]|nr:MAG: hypothetical protein BWX80_03341 [Candidatus Hydrogenedentes bacterium ADurb.Bin101]
MRPSAWEYILRISDSDFTAQHPTSSNQTVGSKNLTEQKKLFCWPFRRPSRRFLRHRFPDHVCHRPFCRFPVRTADGIELDPERIRFSIILDLLLRADPITAVPQPFLGERGGTVGMIFVGIRDLDIERMVGGGIAKPAEPGPNPLSTEIDQMFRQFFPILVSLLEHRLILFVDRDGDEHVV